MIQQSVIAQYYSIFTCRLGLLLVLFLVPSLAKAIPLTEYQKNLQRAITALDTLSQMDEEESVASYENRLTKTTDAVRNAVPERQSVESGDSVFTTDNTWLHKELDELQAVSESKRAAIRNQIVDSLKAIEERVNELERATAHGVTKAEASQRLANILARSEYASKARQSSALTRILDRFIRWLQSLFPQRSPLASSHGSPLTKIAQIFVVSLAVAVIAYVLLKLLRHFRGRTGKTAVKKKKEPRVVLGERLEPEASATDLLTEAEALARKGEIRAAIRKAYIALLVELGDRKVLSLAQHKTNRDYLRAVSSFPLLYSNMSSLTDTFERHWYGFAQTSPADWQNFRAAYIAALRTGN
jgi:Domain of unknown function (DUF4129)